VHIYYAVIGRSGSPSSPPSKADYRRRINMKFSHELHNVCDEFHTALVVAVRNLSGPNLMSFQSSTLSESDILCSFALVSALRICEFSSLIAHAFASLFQ
jgi:hypothetical protein